MPHSFIAICMAHADVHFFICLGLNKWSDPCFTGLRWVSQLTADMEHSGSCSLWLNKIIITFWKGKILLPLWGLLTLASEVPWWYLLPWVDCVFDIKFSGGLLFHLQELG